MKPLEVVCAVIINHDGKLLACQRSTNSLLPGKWEFPGGKIEPGESGEEALKREMLEELEVSISILQPLEIVRHQYPDFDFEIELHPYLCEIRDSKVPHPVEHAQIRWINLADAIELDWAEADQNILQQYHSSILSS